MCSTSCSVSLSCRSNHESIRSLSSWDKFPTCPLRFGGLLRLGQALKILLDKRPVALGALLAHTLEQILADPRRQLEKDRSRCRIELRQFTGGAAADGTAIEVALTGAEPRWTRLARLPARRPLAHPSRHPQRLLHPPRLQHL